MSVNTIGSFTSPAVYDAGNEVASQPKSKSSALALSKNSNRNRVDIMDTFAKILAATVGDEQLKDKSAISEVFQELDVLMRAGTIPATSIVRLDEKYRELTGRTLRQDLPEQYIDCYTSAFQMALDLMYLKSVPLNA
ncbi:hypothetical protein BH10CYA1_BH10CYA1_18310 [soil metagenome]